MKKSPAQTFLSLRQKLKTHEDYQPSVRPPHFKFQTAILAHHLMSLWTSKPPQDHYHYVSIVHQGRFYHQGTMHENILEVPLQNICLFFRQQEPMHLGKMTLFHLIFAIHPDTKPLVMIQKPGESVYYFSLKNLQFWSDFFHPDNSGIHLFSKHTSEEKIKVLIDMQDPWWQTCLYDINIRKLFLKEFFEVYLRICLTPWPLIESLCLQVMGNEHSEFLDYLKFKMNALHEEFFYFLTTEEQDSWGSFIRYDGYHELEQYFKDFEEFTNWLGFLSSQRKHIIKAHIIEKAFQLNIRGMEYFCQPADIPFLSPQTQNDYLCYLLNVFKNRWKAFLQDAEHPYWSLLDNACLHISPYNPHIQIHETHENQQIICKAVQYHQNNIARFFIIKNARLGESINHDDNPASHHYQRSLFFSALILKNSLILNTLKKYHVFPNHEDRIALRAHLLHCVDAHLVESFVFILKNQYNLLYQLDENNRLFRHVLEDYCQANNPLFFELIPKENPRPISFFNRSSSSDSDTCSDADSPSTNYQKRHATP